MSCSSAVRATHCGQEIVYNNIIMVECLQDGDIQRTVNSRSDLIVDCSSMIDDTDAKGHCVELIKACSSTVGE